MFQVPNNKVACEPFQSLAIEKQGTKAFVTAKQKTSLMGTKVVFAPLSPPFNVLQTPSHGLGWLKPGDTVFVRGDATPQFGREIYWTGEEGTGQKFILVPFDAIQLVDTLDVPFHFQLTTPPIPVKL